MGYPPRERPVRRHDDDPGVGVCDEELAQKMLNCMGLAAAAAAVHEHGVGVLKGLGYDVLGQVLLLRPVVSVRGNDHLAGIRPVSGDQAVILQPGR